MVERGTGLGHLAVKCSSGWVWAGSGGSWGGSLILGETVRMGKPFPLG